MSLKNALPAGPAKALPGAAQSLLTTFLASLAFLLLTAGPAFPGQATLSWDPPTTNVDGTPLTDLAGYRVYYGTVSQSYTQSIDVGNVTTYTVANLPDGATYYFAVTALDTEGNESAYSNEVTKTLQAVAQYTLTVQRSGTGAGTVTAAGISCGADCTEVYTQGTVVTLTAAPAAGTTFTGWSGGGCTTSTVCSTTMNGNTTVTANFTLTATYTVTASAGTGGTISPSGSVSVAGGASQTFTITPAAGFHIAGVTVDGAPVGPVPGYTFSNVTAHHTIAATFNANPVNGACGSSNGGTFTSAPATNLCTAGTPSAVTGSGPWAWTCAGANGGTTAACSANILKWTLTASAGSGGSISPSGSVTVNYGANQTFTMTPAAGYHIAGVTVDGAPVGAFSAYTFSNIAANHTIAATFALNTYTISASAGSGGSISPSGTVTLSHGASQTFTISPAPGYQIAGVTIDGVPVGALGTYTFSSVATDHAISATFTAADSDGDGLTDREESGPAGGNALYDGNGDGVADRLQGNVASFHTFNNASYVTIVSDQNAPLRTVNAQQVPAGSPQGLSFPLSFIEFSIDNLDPGAAATLRILLPQGAVANTYYKYGPTPDNPTPHWYEFMYDGLTGAEITGNLVVLHFVDGMRGDDDLTANGFIIDQGGPAERAFAVTASAGSGGAISPAGVVQVPAGAAQSFTITPAQGYRVRDVLVDGVSSGPVTTVTLYNVSSNRTVTASFESTAPPLAPKIAVSPVSYNFGRVKVRWSVTGSIQVTNTGTANLTITGVTFSGANADMFSLTLAGTMTLAPGSSYSLRPRFSPTSKGTKTATMSIQTNAGPAQVTLTGTGR